MSSSDPQPETQPIEVEVTTDAQSQDELRQLYLEQQQRLSCPGCGETGPLF